MSNLRYIAETPKTRGETFSFHMPLSEFGEHTYDSLARVLEDAVRAFVRHNYVEKAGHILVEVLDFEVRQDYLKDIAIIGIVYEYKATMLNTANKLLWNRHKLTHPELNFFMRRW